MIAREKPVMILGAGLAGLTAAAYLRRHGVHVRVFEAGPTISGLCRSEKDEDGYTYDCGAHFITNRLAAAVGISSACRHFVGMSAHAAVRRIGSLRGSVLFLSIRTPDFTELRRQRIVQQSYWSISQKAGLGRGAISQRLWI